MTPVEQAEVFWKEASKLRNMRDLDRLSYFSDILPVTNRTEAETVSLVLREPTLAQRWRQLCLKKDPRIAGLDIA